MALLADKSLQAAVDRVVAIGHFGIIDFRLFDRLSGHMLNHAGTAALRKVLGASLGSDHRLPVSLVKHLWVL